MALCRGFRRSYNSVQWQRCGDVLVVGGPEGPTRRFITALRPVAASAAPTTARNGKRCGDVLVVGGPEGPTASTLTFGNFLHTFAPFRIVVRFPRHHDPTMQITNHPGHAALRRGRYSEPGRDYLVTSVTSRRQPWFSDATVAAVTGRTLHERNLWRNSELLAWVLMPDHVHLLVRLGDDESLSRLVARVKTIVARQARQARATGLPFWSSSFHDHALRHDEDLLAVARYIIANPVRAGLVRSALDWPFWGCVWLPHAARDLIEAP